MKRAYGSMGLAALAALALASCGGDSTEAANAEETTATTVTLAPPSQSSVTLEELSELGATLALIFYLVLRGGLLATGTGPNALNPYGVAALAGLAGMFTKQATNKLDELFSTLFKTDKDRVLKDKLDRQNEGGSVPPQ